MPSAKVHRISATSPDDVSGLEAYIQAGHLRPENVIAVLGKTEGNGCVNDFSRGFATHSLVDFFSKQIGDKAASSICYVMSGGTEGALAPHWTVFERCHDQGEPGPSLAIGSAHTAPLPAYHLGRREQVAMVADGVRAAMSDANIVVSSDVHFVQVKCPLLTVARIESVRRDGKSAAANDTLKSMALSRAASALGVAVALGEESLDRIEDKDIGSDTNLWSERASCSAGIELTGHEILVLGMSDRWTGSLAVDHAVMHDAIDIEPVRSAMSRLGLPTQGQLSPDQRAALVAMLGKAEASKSGSLRGYRHTMLDDSDISSTRHARAFVCGVLAGLAGHAEIYVSGGAEHQGPDGGGPVAIIVDRAKLPTA